MENLRGAFKNGAVVTAAGRERDCVRDAKESTE
jgi:hypothetical protein